MNATPERRIDFDLHGFVSVRLLDATHAEAEAVRRQLGPIEMPLDREPDITCRFVDRLERTANLRYIGLDDAAFTDDAYLILRSRHKSKARVQVPFSSIGRQCELICERGLRAVPLLVAIINLTALAKGFVPLHASAFRYGETGVMVVGWAKGGKTEALLGFMANGASYIGDEWIYVASDGSRIFGIPEPMKIWAAHLASMPVFRDAASVGERLRLASLESSVRLARGTAAVTRKTPLGALLRRSLPMLQQQAYVHLSPTQLFGEERTELSGGLDVVVLAMTHDAPQVVVEETDIDEMSRRMPFSVEFERLELMAHYLRFRFAFPDATNPLLDDALERQRNLLRAALSGKRALTLLHPYPAPIPEMYEALRQCLP